MGRKSKEQLDKERQSKSVNKHVKKHYKRYEFRFHNDRQKDIIEYLEQKENKQQYITDLIRKDMEHNRE